MNKGSEKEAEYYLHQVTYNYRERIVGFFVFSGFILFLFFILVSVKNQHLFEERAMFYIEVNSSEGIARGNSVNYLGTEIGRVVDLNLVQGHKIKVSIEVYEKHRTHIRSGAKAIVNRLTNIGSALIEIESDSIDAPILLAGTTIPVEETPSLNDLLLGIANIIQSADNNDLFNKFEIVFPKVEGALNNIEKIIAQIATGHGTLGAAVFDQGVEKELKVVVRSGAEILSEAEGIISIAKKRLIQLEPILSDAKSMSYDMAGATKTLPLMMAELNQIVSQVKMALTLINGELQNIPGVSADTRRTLSKAEQLIDSTQQIWPLSNAGKAKESKQLIPPHSNYE